MLMTGKLEETAAQFRGINGRNRLEYASIGEQFDQAAQDSVISPDPDIVVQRPVELRTTTASMPAHDGDQLPGRLIVARIIDLQVTRRDAIAALPTHC